MATFQRARSEEQREVRRRRVLETGAEMLEEMPVAAISLNELARRAGMAKSNVLRYFESRESVLLDLLAGAAARFRAELDDGLPGAPDAPEPAEVRARGVAVALAGAFGAHPTLCELLSAQWAVLEHNVSVDVALRYKRAARDGIRWQAGFLQRLLPELDDQRALRASSMVILLVGALWTRSHPSPAVLEAFATDTSLEFLHPSFTDALAEAIATFLVGLLADPA
ncbi:TetR family transcriptional regulator [Actinomycetospora straminea]|uniref:TetR/AcrR family transcriptional regulator n=1 Tax=Actinomycetospora straminea TaxID=663607 RepID=A0ABP9EHP6_9PSEU|nr:TetR family transcriptional regulator [Actinomycetospora straminea]MDD7935699.1 TetR family transcriptional regulator [Actinomycetospora straminea]